MEKHLSPSILAADFGKLGEQLAQVESAGADYLHLDVMDGIFVPSISFGMPVIESIRKKSNLFFDVHMMVVDPARYFDAVKKAGADLICIHVEACKDPKKDLETIHDMGLKSALAFNPDTPVDTVTPYLEYADMILVMSVNPGFGGQKFIDSSYGKVEELCKLREQKKLKFLIEIDGGINKDNVESVVAAGIDVVVAGSAVFKDDISENVRFMNEIIKKYEN